MTDESFLSAAARFNDRKKTILAAGQKLGKPQDIGCMSGPDTSARIRNLPLILPSAEEWGSRSDSYHAALKASEETFETTAKPEKPPGGVTNISRG